MTEDHDEDERLMLVLGRHVEATRNAAAFEAAARAICWVSECEFRICTAARRCMAEPVDGEYKDQALAAIAAASTAKDERVRELEALLRRALPILDGYDEFALEVEAALNKDQVDGRHE